MPTPFTHLAIARRMLTDTTLTAAAADVINAQRGAFYLGQVAADGHYLAKRERYETHFYKYTYMPDDPPWRVMMAEYPQLWQQKDQAAQAFLAGYVAHLAVDEYWARHLTVPYFGNVQWGSQGFRFLMLNLLLILMDERDFTVITYPEAEQKLMAEQLHNASPNNWLPFLPDHALCEWGELVCRQIKPGGKSETLDILAPRLGRDMTPEKLQAMLNSEAKLDKDLWAHVPKTVWNETEELMYSYACAQITAYVDESQS